MIAVHQCPDRIGRTTGQSNERMPDNLADF